MIDSRCRAGLAVVVERRHQLVRGVDRLVRHHGGAVIDWIDFRWWPVFNVADACIVVGAILLALTGWTRRA